VSFAICSRAFLCMVLIRLDDSAPSLPSQY
jgi:hypothetical protein